MALYLLTRKVSDYPRWTIRTYRCLDGVTFIQWSSLGSWVRIMIGYWYSKKCSGDVTHDELYNSSICLCHHPHWINETISAPQRPPLPAPFPNLTHKNFSKTSARSISHPLLKDKEMESSVLELSLMGSVRHQHALSFSLSIYLCDFLSHIK